MILLDGGIRSEMDLRVPTTVNNDPAWCACHHTLNPTILQEVYQDFAMSGSQILSANTYGILQYLTKETDDEIQASVTKAVQITEQVRKLHPDIRIAGCLSAHNCHDYADDDVKKKSAPP